MWTNYFYKIGFYALIMNGGVHKMIRKRNSDNNQIRRKINIDRNSQINIAIARQLRNEAYQCYINRGIDHKKAQVLAKTVEWAFGRERPDLL